MHNVGQFMLIRLICPYVAIGVHEKANRREGLLKWIMCWSNIKRSRVDSEAMGNVIIPSCPSTPSSDGYLLEPKFVNLCIAYDACTSFSLMCGDEIDQERVPIQIQVLQCTELLQILCPGFYTIYTGNTHRNKKGFFLHLFIHLSYYLLFQNIVPLHIFRYIVFQNHHWLLWPILPWALRTLNFVLIYAQVVINSAFNSYSAGHNNWCTETLWNRVITAQCEGMGEVGSARYEPALLPPCPSIRALCYSNCQEIHPITPAV